MILGKYYQNFRRLNNWMKYPQFFCMYLIKAANSRSTAFMVLYSSPRKDVEYPIFSMIKRTQTQCSYILFGCNTSSYRHYSENWAPCWHFTSSQWVYSFRKIQKVSSYLASYCTSFLSYWKTRLSFKGTSISIKWCFENHCSCDKTCQFSSLQGTPCRSYLEKLTNGDKYINKRVRFFIHQKYVSKTCQEKKLLLIRKFFKTFVEVHTSAKWLFDYF